MNDEQRAIFVKILDLNWDIKQKKNELALAEQEMNKLDRELHKSMGHNAYCEFMNRGQQMFAPKAA